MQNSIISWVTQNEDGQKYRVCQLPTGSCFSYVQMPQLLTSGDNALSEGTAPGGSILTATAHVGWGWPVGWVVAKVLL